MREREDLELLHYALVAGDEDLENYGLFAGATYTCDVAPINAPEQVTTALVSQTMYQDVRDGYAVYFFKEEAETPVLELCETKDYVIDQRISLEMPETARAWTAEDGLERFLSESGAYVKLVLRFTDDLDTETYAEYLYDFEDTRCLYLLFFRTWGGEDLDDNGIGVCVQNEEIAEIAYKKTEAPDETLYNLQKRNH